MRTYEDLGEAFLVIAVHQKGPANLAEVRAAVAAADARVSALGSELRAALPPTVVLDDKSGALFQGFAPKALGDMVLLDSSGAVVASGAEAESRLRETLAALRRDVTARTGALQAAKDPAKVKAALVALLECDLHVAAEAANRFAAACPPALAPAVLTTMVRAGRCDALVEALDAADAKRRRVAIEVATAEPRPDLADALARAAGRSKLSADEAYAALRALALCAPAHPALEGLAIELSKRAETPSRVRGLELLGRIATPGAKAQVLAVLRSDAGKVARAAAATALGVIGGDDVPEILRKVAADDRVPEVRAAAQKALDALVAK